MKVVLNRRRKTGVDEAMNQNLPMDFVYFIVGVSAGWAIAHFYYKKAGEDQKRELQSLKTQLAPKTKLQDFVELLKNSSWTNSSLDGKLVWLADLDNTFQIHRGQEYREFSEPWTDVFPDKHSSACTVSLRINNVPIKEMEFVSADNGRIFVPIPEVRHKNGSDDREFYWSSSSLRVQICNHIGSYYIYDNLEGVAKVSGIVIDE